MNLIDRIHTRHQIDGSRRIRDDVMEMIGKKVNLKRVQRIMRVMGIIAIYPTTKTTKPGKGPEHKVFPNLLRGVEVTRPNQVWATDIERHEALQDRAVMKGHRLQSVAAG